MQAFRLCLATVCILAAALPAAAQKAPATFKNQTSVGVNLGSTDYLYARSMLGESWGAEVGVLEGNSAQPGQRGRTQGLNFAMVGRAPVWQSLGVYGKVGTTYGLAQPDGLGMRPYGLGMSFGAGLSYDFNSRLSATLAWDSHDFRFGSGGANREPVRSTSVGLQYRY